jgi:hypothetical protein
VRWHAEGEDHVFKAVVLKILVEVAFMAIKYRQPVYPYLMYFCMSIKVL